jgi:hypothetical protein
MNCAVHPERQANNLCIKCGNWYCDECMDFSNGQHICKRCRYGQRQQPEICFVNPIGIIQNLVVNMPREWAIVFTVCYFVVFALLVVSAIYMMIRYTAFFMYIPVAIYLLFGGLFYFLFVHNKRVN